MILQGELYKFKKIVITQKYICIFISSMMFLNEILRAFTKHIELDFSNINLLEEVSSQISKIVFNGKQKIKEISFEWYDFLNKSIISSFNIYPQIDWSKDNEKDVVSKSKEFMVRLSNLSTVYVSMSTILPVSQTEELSVIICKHLIEILQKQINIMPKIEIKSNAKE